MVAERNHKYGLEFSEATVSLVRLQGAGSFEFVKKAKVDDADFRSKMAKMHDIVSDDPEQMVSIPLFLRRADTPVLTVRLSEDESATETIDNAIRADSGRRLRSLTYVLGERTNAGQKVIYAHRDLMAEAQSFVEQFNFTAAYFAPRVRVEGFDDQIVFDMKRTALQHPLTKRLGAIAALLALSVGVGYSALQSGVFDPPPEPNILLDPVSTDVQLAPKALTLRVTGLSTPISNDVFDRNERRVIPLSSPQTTEPLNFFALTGIAGEENKYLTPEEIAELEGSEGETTENIQVAISNDVESEITGQIEVSTNQPSEIEPEPTIEELIALDFQSNEQEAGVDPNIRGGAIGSRPIRRPENLIIVQTPPDLVVSAAQAIANDILEIAIAEEEQKAANIASASKYAALVSARPPRKTNRWTTNLALFVEARRIAAANIELQGNPEDEIDVGSIEEKDVRRVSGTYRKNQLSLIGVVGAPKSRRAIFRTPTGGIRTIKQGQKISGWQLVAIGESTVKVVRQGKEKTMRLP